MIEEIQSIQNAYFLSNGKYLQIKEFNGDPNIYCHEYSGPLGAGYIIYEKDGNLLKATDMGPEGRSFDWREND